MISVSLKTGRNNCLKGWNQNSRDRCSTVLDTIVVAQFRNGSHNLEEQLKNSNFFNAMLNRIVKFVRNRGTANDNNSEERKIQRILQLQQQQEQQRQQQQQQEQQRQQELQDITFQPGLESTRVVFAQDSMGFESSELFDDTTVVDTNTNTSLEDTFAGCLQRKF